MDSTTDAIDDRIANAILGDSTYDEVRVRRFSYFKQPIPSKLAYQSALLFALAFVAPVAALYPEPVAALFPGGDPLSASPVVALLALFTLGVELLAAVGHVAVATVVVWRRPEMTEDRVRDLVAVEDVASLLALGTGAFAFLVTYAYVLLGHAGVDAVRWYVAVGGRSPFDASGTDVTLTLVAGVAAVASVAVFTASRYFDARL